MGKRFNYHDRKKLLEVRESGLSDADLKRKFGITDQRTLARHLRLAEQENEAKMVKVEIVKDALLDHLAEVRNLIEQWEISLKAPRPDEIYPVTTPPIDSVRTNPLFSSLKDHLPFPTLWRGYSTYSTKTDDYFDKCKSLREEVNSEVASWNGVKDIVTTSVAQYVLRSIADTASGNAIELPQLRFSESYNNPGATRVQVNDHLLFDLVKDGDPEALGKRYLDYSVALLQGEAGTNLTVLFGDLRNNLEPKIKDSLQEILLRRDYIMYTCKLCPGQPRLSR